VAKRSAHRCAARAHAGGREPDFTRDYYDSAKRYIGNAVQVFFKRRSRHQAHRRGLSDRASPAARGRLPVLRKKFEGGVRGHFGDEQAGQIMRIVCGSQRAGGMPVNDMMSALVHTGGAGT
jgi:2-methylcitrate dehydratase